MKMELDVDEQSNWSSSNEMLHGMCRLCLCSCNDENSVEIFFTNDLSLNVRIMACAGLEVTKQDQLPKRICMDCRLMLEKSFLFRNKCKNSDSKLRRHIRLINAGKESNVFDDSDDEYEDDYTESLKLISDLSKKIQQKRKLNEILVETSNAPVIIAPQAEAAAASKVAVQVIPGKSNTTANEMSNQFNLETITSNRAATKTTSNSAVRTRASNRVRNLPAEIKIPETSIIYDANGQTIEVLVEDISGGGAAGEQDETEFIISDAIENAFDGQFQSNDSNDEEFEALIANSENQFENEQFSLQDVTKSEDIYISEESMDNNKIVDDDEDDDDIDDDDDDADRPNNDDASILESILPTIKQSIAARNGTVLDHQTQYKIVRANGDEIKVQCITADGTEFEVEMKSSLSTTDYERDETGDLKIFSCSKCPKTFSRRGKLINHERDHNAKSTGQECPYCQKWFPSNSTLTRHIRVHTGEKPFKCQVCNRSFIQKEILKRHLMTHSGERPYKCQHCSKSFILKEALRQHINRNHTENPTPEMHNCPFCPKSFCHSSGLSRHLLIHAGRTFACDYCNKKFNDKSALKRHTISIHNVTPQNKKNQYINCTL